MSDLSKGQIWANRTGYFVVCLSILIIDLIPLNTVPRQWPWPDFIAILTLYLAQTDKRFVPLWLVASTILLQDFLLMRPPGLMAALIVISVLILHIRSKPHEERTLLSDWMEIAFAFAAITLLYYIVMQLSLTPTPSLRMSVIQTILNILVYPIVMVCSELLFNLRQAKPHQKPLTKGF